MFKARDSKARSLCSSHLHPKLTLAKLNSYTSQSASLGAQVTHALALDVSPPALNAALLCTSVINRSVSCDADILSTKLSLGQPDSIEMC